MSQWRAIPIQWGLSTDKYHKFLMWVSFKSTFNDWGRCDSLQVTFTAREVASKFDVSHTTATNWTNRAKADGLLLPTLSYRKETGMGEIYFLGGDLLSTLKSGCQATLQEVSKPLPSNETQTIETNVIYAEIVDDGLPSPCQEVAKQVAVNRNTPDTPDTPREKSNKKANKLKPWMVSFSPDVLSAVGEILAFWPRGSEAQPKSYKGETVPVTSGPKLADRLSALAQDGADLQVCVAIARRYTEEFKRGDHWSKAAENFFGKTDKAEYSIYYQAHITNEAPNA